METGWGFLCIVTHFFFVLLFCWLLATFVIVRTKSLHMAQFLDIEILSPQALNVNDIKLHVNPNIFSRDVLREMLMSVTSEYIAVVTTNNPFDVSTNSLVFMTDCLQEDGVSCVYADYIVQDGTVRNLCNLSEPERHIVRDTFDYGPVLVLRSAVARNVAVNMPANSYASIYGLWLGAQRYGSLYHTAVPVGIVRPSDNRSSDKKQFDYVNPLYKTYQKELEIVFTSHLQEIGAALNGNLLLDYVPTDPFDDEASVIIPVRNRHVTIADAIRSALRQKTNFRFNVIVVDNHSSDGTSEIIDKIAADHVNLIHIIPQSDDLGIGGCWNLAIADSHCGRYAVQLDSDDLYSSDDVLQTIVDKLRSGNHAMVVGSYKLVDFSLNPIPPGLIDHKEWTDDNGPNNILRVNGLGAPRAFATEWLRANPLPNVSYGEDYAAGLRATRNFKIGRIYKPLYLCRRWNGNSDSGISRKTEMAHNEYKDKLRSDEIDIRIRQNKKVL